MAKEYRILKITSLIREAKEGGIEPYYRVQYETAGGIVDTVNISAEDYTEEKVPATLLALARKHDKILAL